jgi:hypothetical protein
MAIKPLKAPVPREQPDHSTFGDQALEAMHLRLVDYGLCWLRGGASDVQIIRREIIGAEPGDPEDASRMRIVSTSYRDPDLDRQSRFWTPAEIKAAARLHSRIIRLPLKVHGITIMVFYGETCAEDWRWREPNNKAKILRDLTFWPSKPYGVNARLARYGRETGQRMAPIRPDEFLPTMLRAVRILVNGDRALEQIT